MRSAFHLFFLLTGVFLAGPAHAQLPFGPDEHDIVDFSSGYFHEFDLDRGNVSEGRLVITVTPAMATGENARAWTFACEWTKDPSVARGAFTIVTNAAAQLVLSGAVSDGSSEAGVRFYQAQKEDKIAVFCSHDGRQGLGWIPMDTLMSVSSAQEPTVYEFNVPLYAFDE